MTDGKGGPLTDVAGPHGQQPVVAAGAPRGAAEAAVIALHGRGATAQGIVNLLDPIYRHGVAILAPQADRSRWYPHSVSAPVEQNEPYVSSALAVVEALIDDAVSGLGVAPGHVVLLGFSQGACVVGEYAARNPGPAAVAVLNGTLLGPEIDSGTYRGSFEGAPVLVASGRDDQRVDLDRVRQTATVFRALGGDVTERIYDGVGHEVTDDEFGYLEALLAEFLDDEQ